jgi:hypothetical protein
MAATIIRHIMKKCTPFLAIFYATIVMGFVASLCCSVNVFAEVTGSCTNDGNQPFGRSYCYGYFNDVLDKGAAGNGQVLPAISDGQAIPTSAVGLDSNSGNSDKLCGLLYSDYTSGDRQSRTGAAFVYNTMMSSTAPGVGREGVTGSCGGSSDSGDWNNLKQTLEGLDSAGKIDWGATYAGDNVISSFWQGTNDSHSDDDTFFVKYSIPAQDAIKFYDYNGNLVYTLLRTCANPVGHLLPGWTITPTASVQSTASLGATVTWTHTVTNNGPNSTDKDINYYYQDSDASGNVSGSRIPATNSPIKNPISSGSSVSSSSTKTITATGTYCRVTIAVPKSSTDTGSVQSAPACVTVGTPTPSVCRPMKIHIDGIVGAHTYHSPPTQGGSSSTDANTPIPIHIDATSVDDNGHSISHSFPDVMTTTDVDVTSYCTTGTTWTFHIYTDEYTATHINVCHSWYRGSCTRWTHDSTNNQVSITITKGPCFDYTLATEVKNLAYYQVEPDTVFDITPLLTSDSWTRINESSFYNAYLSSGGLHTKTKSTQWQVSVLTVKPNDSVPSAISKNSPLPPCQYYKSLGSMDCQPLASNGVTYNGTANFSKDSTPNVIKTDNSAFTANKTIQTIKNYTVPDLAAGTKVCFVFSVSPVSSDANTRDVSNTKSDPETMWNNSALNGGENSKCIIVVKKPKVQVLGGDLSVGKDLTTKSNIATTTSVKNINGTIGTFGSWVEYGIFANGSINGMASGSAFSGLGFAGDATKSVCKYSTLSFANVPEGGTTCTGVIGNYTNARSIPNVAASFPVTASVKPLGSGSLDGVHGVHSTNGDISITGGTIQKGQWIVINAPTASITITGNIKYTGDTLYSVDDIPQVVIIAKNIYIDDNKNTPNDVVSQVDAWLIAKSGVINTCTEGEDNTTHITANDCKDPLTVNGPVMAQHLYLRRTAGSGTGAASGDPAEIFNLRADAYLWAYARATSSGRVQTVYTTELPPRF